MHIQATFEDSSEIDNGDQADRDAKTLENFKQDDVFNAIPMNVKMILIAQYCECVYHYFYMFISFISS